MATPCVPSEVFILALRQHAQTVFLAGLWLILPQMRDFVAVPDGKAPRPPLSHQCRAMGRRAVIESCLAGTKIWLRVATGYVKFSKVIMQAIAQAAVVACYL